MKKALGIMLLVLALSLVSAPAFARQGELNLKLWYPDVVGVDEWVADYGTYIVPSDPEEQLPWPHKNENELVLQPGSGLSFILSGEYFIFPSISVGGSYWGFSPAAEVGVELKNEDSKWHWIALPWFEDELPLPWQEAEATLAGKETLSMSALDVHETKTFSGPGWEVGLSGGVRWATFNEHLSIGLDVTGEREYDRENGEGDYHVWEGRKLLVDLSSKVSVSAIGPQVGVEGTYGLADKLVLKAGAKAGFLFGNTRTDATWIVETWGYYHEEEVNNGVELNVLSAQAGEDPYEWERDDRQRTDHKPTDTIQIVTYDLNAGLAYRITEQLSVEAGYYASIWQGMPSLYHCYPEYMTEESAEDTEPGWKWKQAEARTITVRGLTLGVNFRF